MNLQSTIDFLFRLYDNPSERNLTRLEHEAIGEALRRLLEIQDGSGEPVVTGPSRDRLRLLLGGAKPEGRRCDNRDM